MILYALFVLYDGKIVKDALRIALMRPVKRIYAISVENMP